MTEPATTCTQCAANENLTDQERFDPEASHPTHWWHCTSCGDHLERWRGQGDQSCACGAQYNASGQRLRDDWRDNPAWDDDEIDDLTGFEISQLRGEGVL